MAKWIDPQKFFPKKMALFYARSNIAGILNTSFWIGIMGAGGSTFPIRIAMFSTAKMTLGVSSMGR